MYFQDFVAASQRYPFRGTARKEPETLHLSKGVIITTRLTRSSSSINVCRGDRRRGRSTETVSSDQLIDGRQRRLEAVQLFFRPPNEFLGTSPSSSNFAALSAYRGQGHRMTSKRKSCGFPPVQGIRWGKGMQLSEASKTEGNTEVSCITVYCLFAPLW